MHLAIMQPYLFPYIGYFQLMHAVDEFVIYDNIKYTKKGWINRNRILSGGKDVYITLPLKKDSDFKDIVERSLSDTWPADKKKLLHSISNAYRKAPYFNAVFPLIELILNYEDQNLFNFILNSLEVLRQYLGIDTKMIVSSTVRIDHGLKGEEKVIQICKARRADVYINAIGGLSLYKKKNFLEHGIELKFIRADKIEYRQLQDDFVPWLSIIDVSMFNSKAKISELLAKYSFVQEAENESAL